MDILTCRPALLSSLRPCNRKQTRHVSRSLKRSNNRRASRPTSCSAATTPALKEWAPIVEALGHGDQTIMLRKGGIKDPTFCPRAGISLLFPTSFHTDSTLLKPDAQTTYRDACEYDPKAQTQLVFPYVAQLCGAWASTSSATALLSALDRLHIYGPDFLEARLRWKPSQPITILEFRVFKLKEPLTVQPREEFWGCFSYVDIPLETTSLETILQGAVPVLDDEVFAEKQRLCREALANIQDLQQVLPK